MSQKENIISVNQLNDIIKQIITDKLSSVIKVKGEISNMKLSNNNVYFTLKDDISSISAVLWSRLNTDKADKFKNGDDVIVTGKITCYTKQGNYQITASKIERIGIGNLHEQYEKLKNDYQKSGYFSKKREFPKYVNRIGILTSSDGAALQDVLYVLNSNKFYGDIYIKNCFVQGNLCPKSVKDGIEYFNKLNNESTIDLLLITRGGGSFEDLMGYSSEEIVKSIYNSNIFTISAVGHEIDWMLSDLAADCRAPTPSIAGEMISTVQKRKRDMLTDINSKLEKFRMLIDNKINNYVDKILSSKNMLNVLNPANCIDKELDKIRKCREIYTNKIYSRIDQLLESCINLKRTNDKYSSDKTFEKGYVAIIDDENNLISDKKTFKNMIKKKQKLKIIFVDGEYDIKRLYNK